ncbi:MAG: HD domain-containing phosphohydrolase [Thermovirgaceae bacterium]
MALPIVIDEEVEAAYSIYRDITKRKFSEKELLKSIRKIRRIWVQTLRLVTAIIEKRDPSIAGHHRRVAALCRAMALRMELSSSRRSALRFAACLHDIGKIQIPSEILSKPGRLTDLEFGLIKGHVETGYKLLKEIDLPADVAEIVRQHHERMDGSGYPRGLHGDEVLIEARILAVADVVEAMSSHRPYRAAPGLEKALDEISDGRGVLYDPAAVDACISVFREGFSLERLDQSGRLEMR